METKALAEAQPSWRFIGVDPSAMLDLARQTLVFVADHVELLEGMVDQARMARSTVQHASSLLHHIDRDQRLRTLQESIAASNPARAW